MSAAEVNLVTQRIHAPIALFVYNRPQHTQHTLEALLNNVLASQSDLYVFSDGPKVPAAETAVNEVRNYIRGVTGFRSITILEERKNKGLARSIIDGVTTLCNSHSRVIVLEDDLSTSPHFLEYMNDALNRYQADARVMQIAGYMFPHVPKVQEDALFLPFISSWGWATWKRAWETFDRREDVFEEIMSDATMRRRFDLNGKYKYSKILRAQQLKKVDSWAIFWYVSVFRQKGLTLFPKYTLVRNIGFDGSGVNCAVREFEQDEMNSAYRVDRFPSLIEISDRADEVIDNIPATRLNIASVFRRVMRVIR